jgi:hypothetical protein
MFHVNKMYDLFQSFIHLQIKSYQIRLFKIVITILKVALINKRVNFVSQPQMVYTLFQKKQI